MANSGQQNKSEAANGQENHGPRLIAGRSAAMSRRPSGPRVAYERNGRGRPVALSARVGASVLK